MKNNTRRRRKEKVFVNNGQLRLWMLPLVAHANPLGKNEIASVAIEIHNNTHLFLCEIFAPVYISLSSYQSDKDDWLVVRMKICWTDGLMECLLGIFKEDEQEYIYRSKTRCFPPCSSEQKTITWKYLWASQFPMIDMMEQIGLCFLIYVLFAFFHRDFVS